MSEPLNEFQANEAFQGFLEERGVSGTVVPPAQVEAPAEEAAPVEEEAVAPEPVAETADPPRDEKGRFTTDKRFEEAQRLIGRQGQELGELRKQLEELTAAQQRAQEPQPQQYDLSNVDDVILQEGDSNLAQQLAFAAWKQKDTIAYEKALRAWGAIDSFSAARFDQQRLVHEMEQRITQQFEPAIQATQQLTQAQQVQAATLVAQQEYPDIHEVITTTDLDEIPEAYKTAFRANPADPAALKILYLGALTVNPERASQEADNAVAQATADQTAASELLKQQAAVATPSAPAAEDTGDDEWGAMPHPDEVHGWDEVTRLSPDFYKRLLTPPPTSLQRTV